MPLGLTPEERVLRARIAGHALWAKVENPTQYTAVARKAFNDRFEREVDPDGVLPAEERARRATHARKAHFTRMALASAKARREKKGRDG